MAQMDWLEWLKAEGFLKWGPAREAAEELRQAQKEFLELPGILQQAGYKKKDALTVEAFVEITTRLAKQQTLEGQFQTMMILDALRDRSSP